MIAIIHPSRSRPDLALKAATSWIQNAGCKIYYTLSTDHDDPMRSHYNNNFNGFYGVGGKWSEIVGVNKSAIEAINRAAISIMNNKNIEADIIIQIADDFQCFPNWGKAIEDLMRGKTDWILKTQDGIQPWVITLPIMDRIYYERFNYIYHHSYKHQFCDTEMTCVAELLGRKVNTRMFFRHLNDGDTKIKDEISERNDATFEEGKRNFIERKKINFGLSENAIIGKMTDNIYTRMQ